MVRVPLLRGLLSSEATGCSRFWNSTHVVGGSETKLSTPFLPIVGNSETVWSIGEIPISPIHEFHCNILSANRWVVS